jgi:hypothetical protein
MSLPTVDGVEGTLLFCKFRILGWEETVVNSEKCLKSLAEKNKQMLGRSRFSWKRRRDFDGRIGQNFPDDI